MGIKVTVEGMNDVVVLRPHFIPENRLNAVAATRLFSVICGYRLVDVLALMEGAYPLTTMVERTEKPTSSLAVRVIGIPC